MPQTTEESLEVLGIEGMLPADQLRRAYLRAVKRHPPEGDPEGFQRVRRAYEHLSELGAEAAERPAGAAPGEVPITPPNPLVAAPGALRGPPAEAFGAPPAASRSKSVEEWWQEAETLRASGAQEALVTLLRSGEQLPMPGFLFARLLETGIEHESDLQRACALLQERELLGLAAHHAHRNVPGPIEALVKHALVRVDQQPDAWCTAALLDIVLTLCEYGHLPEARAVFERFGTQPLRSDQVANVEMVIHRDLLAEVVRLPDEFAKRPLVLIAQAVRSLDILATVEELRDYAARDRRAGARAAEMVETYAPGLANPLVYVLDPTGLREVPIPQPQPAAPGQKLPPNPTPWRILLSAFSGAILLFVLVAVSDSCKQTVPPKNAPEYVLPGQRPASVLCEHGTDVCLNARRVSVALAYRSCSEASREQADLERELAQADVNSEQARAALGELQQLVSDCR